jgi:thymidylate synthase
MKYENLNAKYKISDFIFKMKYTIRGPFYYDDEFLTFSQDSKILKVKKKDWYQFKSSDNTITDQILRVFTPLKSNLWRRRIK